MPYGWTPFDANKKPATDSSGFGASPQPGGSSGGGIPINPEWLTALFKGLGGIGGGGGGAAYQPPQPNYAAMVSQYQPALSQPTQPGVPDQTQMLRDALMALLFGGQNGTV